MARVTVVKKSQKAQGRCEKCGKELPVGSAYKWCAPRAGKFARGYRRVRCLDCPSWRPSETTSSSARSAVYGAQEAAEDRLSAWDRQDADELRSILTDAAEGVREGAECYRESQSNMEDGFGHATGSSDELGEKADTLESAADELESAEGDIEDFDEDAVRSEWLADAEVWVLVNLHDASYVTDEPYGSEEDANSFLATLIEQGAAVEGEVEAQTRQALEFDCDVLPEAVRDLAEEAVEEAREEWADNALSMAEDAVNSIEIP